MKALVILIVVGGLALVALYYFGGFADLDPATQGEQFRNAIHEGMTWEEVVDLKEPKKFYAFSSDPSSMTGRGPEQDFSRAYVSDILSKGGVPAGFGFDYVFTGDHAYTLTFDGEGKLTYIEKMRTTKDLFTLPSPS